MRANALRRISRRCRLQHGQDGCCSIFCSARRAEYGRLQNAEPDTESDDDEDRAKANGTRQPQVMNSSPAIWLMASTARLARNRPHGTPNCGHEAMKPRELCERAHSIESSTEPPHSPPTPMPWMNRSTVRMTAPQTPISSYVGTNATAKRGHAHQQQRCNERRLAANAVAIMAKDCRTNRPCQEADRIDCESIQSAQRADRNGGNRAWRRQARSRRCREKSRTILWRCR